MHSAQNRELVSHQPTPKSGHHSTYSTQNGEKRASHQPITVKIIHQTLNEGPGYQDLAGMLKKLKNNQPININEKGSTGETALSHVINLENCAEIIQLLLDNGANPSIKNNVDWQPLYMAVLNKGTEAAKILIDAMQEKKLSLNVKNSYRDQTAYQKAKELYDPNNPDTKVYKDIMSLLAAVGADTTP
jgi:ankyrin repeat protein